MKQLLISFGWWALSMMFGPTVYAWKFITYMGRELLVHKSFWVVTVCTVAMGVFAGMAAGIKGALGVVSSIAGRSAPMDGLTQFAEQLNWINCYFPVPEFFVACAAVLTLMGALTLYGFIKSWIPTIGS